MFWNDPNLYGATFKDVAGKEPFFGAPVAPWANAPWNLPRLVPPTYGFLPPNFPIPPTAINPFAPTALHPFMPPTATNPFAPTAINPFMPPTMFQPYLPPTQFTPYPVSYGLNPPFYGFYRPYPF